MLALPCLILFLMKTRTVNSTHLSETEIACQEKTREPKARIIQTETVIKQQKNDLQ